jgi:hypothetical protein
VLKPVDQKPSDSRGPVTPADADEGLLGSLLGSASLRGGAVGRSGASSPVDLFWAKCSAQDVAHIAPVSHLRPADAGVCVSRRVGGASDGWELPEAVRDGLHGPHHSVTEGDIKRQRMMIILLLFLQKQSLTSAVYLFGLGTLLT